MSALTRLPLAVYARFKSVNFFKYYKRKIIILVGSLLVGALGHGPTGPPKSGPIAVA